MCNACAVPTEASARPVWTIGHGARSLAIFIAILEEERITLVIDVRKMPCSLHRGVMAIPLFAIYSPHALSRDLHEFIQATRQDISELRQEMKRLSQPAYLKRWIKTARRDLASEDYIDDDFF